jgi:anti-anti-sigma factor
MSSSPFLLANGGFVSQPWVGRSARLTSRRLKTSVAVISAHGDIDACNADALTEYTLGHVTASRALILDLRGVEFFGAEGFSALQRLSTCCTQAGTGWAVVPGVAVARMLRIGDPHASLLAADTVDAALAAFCDHPRKPLAQIIGPATLRQSSGCGRTVCGVCGGITAPDTKTGG